MINKYRQINCEKEPLSLSPRSSGTNLRMSLNAPSQEVPGLRTFLSQTVTFTRINIPIYQFITVIAEEQ